MLLLLTACFLLLYGALLLFYFYHWLQVKTFEPAGPDPDVFLSVVVAARNEETTIGRLLHALQQQQYPKELFEVIVVDDYSTDATAKVAQPFLNERVRLMQPEVSAQYSSKKKAIEAGVKAARGLLLVVTDADCLPPPEWLRQIAAFYRQQQAVFIAAPVQLQVQPTLLSIFQVLDFTMLQGITAAGVQAGVHSMCNGANLAYEKKAFEEVDGFKGIDHLASGDDMLLLYKIWRRYPAGVHYLKSKKAIVTTPALASWKAFLQQRIRWSSKATYYQDYRITAVLFFVYGFNVLFLVLVVAAVFNTFNGPILLLYLLGKTVVEGIFLYPVATFFNQRRLLLFFPLLQPLHIVYTVVIGFISQWGTYEWKGRRTR